jgi:isoleucyl-tRNA synthetase
MLDKFEPLKFEFEVLKFWNRYKTYEKQKAKGKRGPKFYWICGPPYTSGKFHVGHFWNYASLKDPLFRYKRMRGFDVWDRGGWDMHGLPTSRRVSADLGLKTKEDIEKFGIDRFVMECQQYAKRTMEQMTEDYIKWGVWYDHKNAYQPIKNEYMEGVWWCIKKAHENGLLYEGYKVMPWCPESETAAAKHELEYKSITEDSIFLKFKLKGKSHEYLIIWTTTPWTIPFNLGVMVHPELEYAEVETDGETWIIAKDLVESFFSQVKRNYHIKKTYKGRELEGWEYEQPLEKEIPMLKEIGDEHKWAFKIVLSKDYVNLESGTGLVHMAPGCGPEDQEVGHKYKLPAFNELDTRGIFSARTGIFKGWRAKTDDTKFIEHFERLGIVVAKMKYTHDYPFHERSKAAVIFRPTKQWFFGVEKIKGKLRDWNKKVNWIPEWAGSKTFDNWLENLRDISITRQREWGTPVPIWKCNCCDHYVVIGSIKELKKYTRWVPENLHRPWIDKVEFVCKKCEKGDSKGMMKRIPDICDVWLDAGCASFISLYFPQTTKYMKRYWPGDFILEAKEQIRGWFNLLFDTAGVMDLGVPFLNCYMYGWINDTSGRKMSKSLGNIIDPYEVTGKYGVDAIRFYMMGAAQPGVDMNYNHEDAEVKFRNLTIFWNMFKFMLDFVQNNKLRDFSKKPKIGFEEKYILSRLHSTIKKVTEMFDSYKLNEIPGTIEEFFLELSRDYIKGVREKSTGTKEERYLVGYTVYNCLLNLLKIFAPIIPFTAEELYQEIKPVFRLKEESVHLFDWPKYDNKLIDAQFEAKMKATNTIISEVLAVRDKEKLGVRWPSQKLIVYTADEKLAKGLAELSSTILSRCNVKEIEIADKKPNWVKLQVKINNVIMAPKFKEKLPVIVGKLIQMSPESIKSKIDKDKTVEIDVDGKDYYIGKEDVYFEEEVPNEWSGADFGMGSLYLSLKMTSELLMEGFAREIVRKIQSMRKTAKMERKNKANVMIASSREFLESLKKFKDEIEEKTGSKVQLGVGTKTNAKFNELLEIREKRIAIGLTPA